MKKKELQQLITKSVKDLEKMVSDKKKGLGLSKKARRDVAQTLTIIREKELVK